MLLNVVHLQTLLTIMVWQRMKRKIQNSVCAELKCHILEEFQRYQNVICMVNYLLFGFF